MKLRITILIAILLIFVSASYVQAIVDESPQQADLTVTDIIFNPENPVAGNSLEINATIENLGDVENIFGARLMITDPNSNPENDNRIEDIYVSEAELICPADVYPDGVINQIDIDILFALWGTSDTNADINNDGIVGINDFLILLAEWGPCEVIIDVAVTEILIDPKEPQLGDIVEVSITYENVGDVATNSTFGYEVTTPDHGFGGGGCCIILEPGDQFSRHITIPVSALGEYEISASITSEDAPDSNPKNNELSLTFVVEEPSFSVGIDDDPILGNVDATVTLIEFGDFQSPFVDRFWTDTFPSNNNFRDVEPEDTKSENKNNDIAKIANAPQIDTYSKISKIQNQERNVLNAPKAIKNINLNLLEKIVDWFRE